MALRMEPFAKKSGREETKRERERDREKEGGERERETLICCLPW